MDRSPRQRGEPREEPPAGPGLGGLLGDGLAARLERWVVEARIDEAARQRARERWLQLQAEEEGSLVGVLADLAERGSPVAVHVRGGRRHRGEVRALGRDFLALRSTTADVIVALAAVASLRGEPGEAPSVGDRSIATSLSLADVLAGLAAERASVLIVVGGGDEAVAGTLRSVGRDVVLVRADTDPPGTVYLPLHAIAEAVLGR